MYVCMNVCMYVCIYVCMYVDRHTVIVLVKWPPRIYGRAKIVKSAALNAKNIVVSTVKQ